MGKRHSSPVQLFIAGAALLFVELTLIRYVPGQIRVLGYFSNFVLLAAFLGAGIGMLAARRWPIPLISYVAPFAFGCLLLLVELGRAFQVLPSSQEFLFLEYKDRGLELRLYPFLTGSFILLAATFVPIGHWVGRTLVGPNPLQRYALNILGSIAGIGGFAVLQIATAPPWLWVFGAASAAALALLGSRRAVALGGIAAVVATTLLAAWATRDARWSPYQKITTGPIHLLPGGGLVQEWRLSGLSPDQQRELVLLEEAEGFTIRINDDSYQTPVDLRDAALARHPELRAYRQQYDLPFAFKGSPTGKVLVLGAGSGNDVAAALRNGATQVDAVDIDPEILRLGARHPEHPYLDSRVHVYVDDARAYLSNTQESYGMIVFGLVDSHVLLSSKTNVRLDSFVFTRESFALARRRLAPGGIMLVSHAVGTPWFYERMRATIGEAFGQPPVVVSKHIRHPIGITYAAGNALDSGEPFSPEVTTLHDDWPFLYLKQPGIPGEYLTAMFLIGMISVLAVYLAGGPLVGIDRHFFALGAGFLLVETRGVAVLAIHIGSTWGVSAAVFAGVLVMALFATLVGEKLLQRSATEHVPDLAYVLLFAALALNYAVPMNLLSARPLAARIVAGAFLVALPLFASGIVFAWSLARSGGAERAIASNLIGAMFGGLVEYTSMATGFRYLLILAAGFYALAWLTELNARRAIAASLVSPPNQIPMGINTSHTIRP
jgi:hypothetical protein